eukprot:COSAG01_NODE_6314_length_3741_cov_18.754256_2_plen_109_part_00
MRAVMGSLAAERRRLAAAREQHACCKTRDWVAVPGGLHPLRLNNVSCLLHAAHGPFCLHSLHCQLSWPRPADGCLLGYMPGEARQMREQLLRGRVSRAFPSWKAVHCD